MNILILGAGQVGTSLAEALVSEGGLEGGVTEPQAKARQALPHRGSWRS